MAITLKGARVDSIEISRKDGVNDIKGSYSLVSSDDKVLAKQSFNGYSDVKVQSSQETKTALEVLMNSIAKDVNLTLGF